MKDTLLTINYDVIFVAKYQFIWIFEELFCGCQVGLLDSIYVLQKHKQFPYYELCVAYQHHTVCLLIKWYQFLQSMMRIMRQRILLGNSIFLAP